jgi:hypothetical protein
MRVWVAGVGVVGPGLDGWSACRDVLRGASVYVEAPAIYPPLDALPPAERRRLGVPIKLALGAGLDAFRDSGADPRAASMVFTSSGGDGENVHRICETLASKDRQVSPTRFHNAVHNAAAGYWSITTGAQGPSTSLCCHDASVAAGLLEAAVQVRTDSADVALIAYDHRYPEPLNAVRPIGGDLAIALVLSATRNERALACLEIEVVSQTAQTTRMEDAALECLRVNVPAARALPLLAAMARAVDTTVTLAYLEPLQLRVRVTPVD